MSQRGAGVFPWSAVHFIGVGGHSMSGLAAALSRLGVAVSGSDVAESVRTARARAAGVRVHIGHDAALVRALPPGAAVVFSTDVPADNPERVAAGGLGLEVVHRSRILDWFLRGGHRAPADTACAIAVTGTHGKSTTTALTGLALLAAGADPTVFVGADAPFLEGGNHRLGQGVAVVAEVDESDGSFQLYSPDVAVVTSAAPEHLEHYGGSFAAVRRAYTRFLGQVRAGGLAVLCADDPELPQLVPPGGETLWYGLGDGAELTATDLELGATSAFTVQWRGRALGRVQLGLPGRHNVRNALAALGVALRLGYPLSAFASAWAQQAGPVRRFEVLARAGGVTVVDDYAHNPTKVAAALAAGRLLQPHRLIAVFQPHRYQRTHQLWDAFAGAFVDADLVVLTDIYAPPGEAPIPGVSSAALAEAIERGSRVPVRRVADRASLPAFCAQLARPGDLFLVMGAGDITLAAHALAERLQAVPAVPAAALPADGSPAR
jgi:UDP-N-acetylmuramate--alanine ligase